MTVPPGRQCSLPDCEREAADPDHPGALCRSHLESDESPEPVTEPDESGVAETTETSGQNADTSPSDHDNPIDVSDVTDEERAEMLREYLEAFVAEFGQVPRLMPLDEEGKAPIIQGRARLDSPEGREFLVDGEEAIHRIREEGARGFALYAGKRDHGTEDVVFVDHDDDDRFPAPTADPTLEVLSGSGQGPHETYRNAGDVQNARVGDNLGEIRAENWYVVAPGSVHPTGGVYHVRAERDVATLADEELDDSMRPASGRRDRDESNSPVQDLGGEGDRPDDDTIDQRLQLAFANNHDGDRIEKVWNGRYSAAGFGDRSGAEFWLANRLDSWVARGDRSLVRRLMDRANLQKWPERPDDSYRDSIMSEVGHQDWYYDPDSENEAGDPVSALPLGLLDTLEPDELRRYARKRGIDWPTTEEVRDRLEDGVHDALRDGETAVIDAPTGAGKSHLVSTTPWRDVDADVTGDEPVIHLSETCTARDENVARSVEAAGVDAGVLYGRKEACPVAGGDYDPRHAGEDDDREPLLIPDPVLGDTPPSQWFDEMCDRRGLSFSDAHARAEEMLGELPCCEGELLCHGTSQWANKPRDSEGNPSRDVVHATHQFAKVPGLVTGSNVVFDEQPDFTTDLGTERVRAAVTAFLQAIDAPVWTWEAFVQLARHDGYGGDAAAERDALEDTIDQDPPREWYFNDRDAHALAPALARAIWRALGDDADANGRHSGSVPHEPPRLDAGARDDDGWNRHWVTVVIDEANEIQTVRDAPHLWSENSGARAVVGLDAHPAHPLWQRNVHPGITVEDVLDSEERALWRRLERNLFVVQVGDATRPYSGSKAREWFEAGNRVREAEYRHLQEAFGTRAAIAPKAVEDPDAVDGSPLETVMRDAGVDDPLTMHQGEEKSRNDFAGERTLVVDGCVDPGDDYVLDLLAEFGYDAEPEVTECPECDGDGCPADPDCRDGHRRAHGREFVGEDADVAEAILGSVRENHTAQSAGRIARRPDQPDDWGIAFLRTNAAPSRFVDLEVPGAEWVATDLQEAIVDELGERPRASTQEIADAVDCSQEHVRKTLGRLEDADVVDRRNGAGKHGADLYGLLVDEPVDAIVNLAGEAGETANGHVQGSSSTWSLAISPPDPVENVAEAADPATDRDPPGSQTGLGAFSGGGRAAHDTD